MLARSVLPALVLALLFSAPAFATTDLRVEGAPADEQVLVDSGAYSGDLIQRVVRVVNAGDETITWPAFRVDPSGGGVVCFEEEFSDCPRVDGTEDFFYLPRPLAPGDSFKLSYVAMPDDETR